MPVDRSEIASLMETDEKVRRDVLQIKAALYETSAV